MKTIQRMVLATLAVASLALAAGCDRQPDPATNPPPSSGSIAR